MIRGFCAFSACKEQETSNEARMFLYDGCLRCVASERLPVWHLVCSKLIYWTQISDLESISIKCISIISSHFISLIHSYLFLVMSKSDDVIKKLCYRFIVWWGLICSYGLWGYETFGASMAAQRLRWSTLHVEACYTLRWRLREHASHCNDLEHCNSLLCNFADFTRWYGRYWIRFYKC